MFECKLCSLLGGICWLNRLHKSNPIKTEIMPEPKKEARNKATKPKKSLTRKHRRMPKYCSCLLKLQLFQIQTGNFTLFGKQFFFKVLTHIFHKIFFLNTVQFRSVLVFF
jgi:hypothetical protein